MSCYTEGSFDEQRIALEWLLALFFLLFKKPPAFSQSIRIDKWRKEYDHYKTSKNRPLWP